MFFKRKSFWIIIFFMILIICRGDNNLEGITDKTEKTRNYVTPEVFGAIGDGITDDTLALQNAINSNICNTVNGRNKVYLITSELVLKSNKKLKNIVILRGFSSNCVLKTEDLSSNIELENVKIKHNGYDSTGLVVYRCKNFYIKNSYISTKTGFSLQIEGSSNIYVDKVMIDNVQLNSDILNYTDGIHIYGGCSGIYINDCDINSGDDAISLTNEYENSSVSIDKIANYNTIKDVYISNCKVDTNARAFTITSGKNRISKSYFKNINVTNLKGFSHGTIHIRRDNQLLFTEISNLRMTNIKLLAKYTSSQSEKLYIEDLIDSKLNDFEIETKRSVSFNNCANSKFKDFNIKYLYTSLIEPVINYKATNSCVFQDFRVSGNTTDVMSINNCNNNSFSGFILRKNNNKTNIFTDVNSGNGNTFKDFIWDGSTDDSKKVIK